MQRKVGGSWNTSVEQSESIISALGAESTLDSGIHFAGLLNQSHSHLAQMASPLAEILFTCVAQKKLMATDDWGLE